MSLTEFLSTHATCIFEMTYLRLLFFQMLFLPNSLRPKCLLLMQMQRVVVGWVRDLSIVRSSSLKCELSFFLFI